MNRRFISFVLIICVIFSITFTHTAFADSGTVALKYIRLNEGRNLSLEVGDVKTLSVTAYPKDATMSQITYSSSDESIAKIDKNGTVKALKVGTVRLTAEMAGKTNSISLTVYKNDDIKATFTEKSVVTGKVTNITINVSSDDKLTTKFYIFLPTGYMVEGNTATFAADQNGKYPFTVYDNNTGTKKTFYYEVTGLTDRVSSTTVTDEIDNNTFDIDILLNNINLMYDYEKKQCLINSPIDKIRTVTLPNKSKIQTNEINYYLGTLKNNTIYDYSFVVDNEQLKCKLLRQGEFYLLILWQENKKDNRNILVTYRAYNFTTNNKIETYPKQDYITENGTYEVFAYNNYGLKEIFQINIDNLDYTKPFLNASINYEGKFDITAIDDYKLDYILTFDGKYIDVSDTYKRNTEFNHLYSVAYDYDGDYIFTAVDSTGNRTNYTVTISGYKRVPYTRTIGLHVHNSNNVELLFKDIGDEYTYINSSQTFYTNTFNGYMRGLTDTKFSPNSTISRAQMITILCRITDLPYDISLATKTKFTDINDHWAINYICMGSSKRYIQGYKDKTFKPDESLTRAEFCKMICNISALKSKLSSIPAVNNYAFDDINSHYAKAEILKLANRGLISGNNENFYPDKPITRAEVIYAINKLYNLTPSKQEFDYMENLFKKYYNFTDIKNSPYYEDIVISVIGIYREQNN